MEIITTTFALFVAVPALYLAFLAAVTLLPRRPPPRHKTGDSMRFAVLVPAHDEELKIGATVASLSRLHYPPDRFSVHVVADNCTDATAAVARGHGACVHERNDPRNPGKGAALNWLAREVAAEVTALDAFVMVDADSELSPNFLSVMADHLRSGAEVVQALHLVAVCEDRPLVRIRELAFQLTCHLRPLANAILGGSSGLQGTGMCFAATLFPRYSWDESSVVEDGELSLRLIRDGHRVALAANATVRQAMPTTFREARSQAVRWERGRFDHVQQALSLMWTGIRRRDRGALLAAFTALTPPFSALAAGGILTLGLAAVLDSRPLAILGLGTLACILFYALRGAALGGLRPGTLLRILLWAPLYTAWKLWVLVLAASGVGRGQWTRTNRAESANARRSSAIASRDGPTPIKSERGRSQNWK